MGKNRYYTRYNGRIYNLSKIQEILDGKSDEDITMTLAHDYGIEPLEALLLEDVINFNNREIPSDLNEAVETYRAFNRSEQEARAVHCIYCNSTNVNKLRYNFYNFGKEWHCNNCGSDF